MDEEREEEREGEEDRFGDLEEVVIEEEYDEREGDG